MPPLIEQLHDIEGFGPVGFWPLAIGWWILIACALGALFLIWRRFLYLRSWKGETLRKLKHLEKNLSPSTSQETVVELSTYLRRIAVRRFPRKECAGLVGDAWLKWLKSHDPKQFDWTGKGKMLIAVPYAQIGQDLPLEPIKEMLQAVKKWVV